MATLVSWRLLCGAVLAAFVVAFCAPLSRLSGAGWCCALLPVVFGCLLLGLAVRCCLLAGPGGSWWRVSALLCLSGRWLAALWFGVVCLGALLPCVVSCGAVLSYSGVPWCSAACFRCCLCLLFLSCFKNHCQTRKNVFAFFFFLKKNEKLYTTHTAARSKTMYPFNNLCSTHVGHALQLLSAMVMVAMLLVLLPVVVLLKFARD